MASGGMRWIWVSVVVMSLAGCWHKEPPAPDAGQADSSIAANAPSLDPHLHQPFSQATLSDPPEDALVPPDTTMTGKSVGKLYEEVKALWDDVRFVSPKGKQLAYNAIVDTEVGTIDIVLRPDLAPNHVRSFVALARAHYFDGLVFERAIHDENPDARLDMIEAGCPLGQGDVGLGSIGYWLKPEASAEGINDEGAVGACHVAGGMDACCFYITLVKIPAMDGDYTVFGKVTRGLDVARKILSLPLSNESSGQRPLKPVVMRSVTIETHEVEKH